MTSLLDKRVRGDMIATYCIMTGKDKVDPRTFFDMAEEGAGPRTRLVAGVHNIKEDQVQTEHKTILLQPESDQHLKLSQTVSRGWGLSMGLRLATTSG